MKKIIISLCVLFGFLLVILCCFFESVINSQKTIYLTSPEELKIKLKSDYWSPKHIFTDYGNSEYQTYPNTRIFKALYDINENDFMRLAKEMKWQIKTFDKQIIVCVKNLTVTFTHGYLYEKMGSRKYIENVFNNFIVSEGIEILYDRKLKKCFFNYTSFQVAIQ